MHPVPHMTPDRIVTTGLQTHKNLWPERVNIGKYYNGCPPKSSKATSINESREIIAGNGSTSHLPTKIKRIKQLNVPPVHGETCITLAHANTICVGFYIDMKQICNLFLMLSNNGLLWGIQYYPHKISSKHVKHHINPYRIINAFNNKECAKLFDFKSFLRKQFIRVVLKCFRCD